MHKVGTLPLNVYDNAPDQAPEQLQFNAPVEDIAAPQPINAQPVRDIREAAAQQAINVQQFI